MFTNIEIGARIEERRTSLGLTMEDVATQIGVAKSTIQRYEKGQINKIKLPVVESIAAALDVNPDWLIGNTDDPTVVRHHGADMLKAALWGGDKDLTPEDLDMMWADVQEFAAFLANKRKKEKE